MIFVINQSVSWLSGWAFHEIKKRSANNLPATDREPIVQAIDQLNTQVAG